MNPSLFTYYSRSNKLHETLINKLYTKQSLYQNCFAAAAGPYYQVGLPLLKLKGNIVQYLVITKSFTEITHLYHISSSWVST